MSVVKARNRLVSFRLTEEELENLRVACLMNGSRNVSEFARAAVLEQAGARPQKDAQIIDRFWAMELRMTELEGGVRRNAEMLRTLLKNLVSGAAPAREKDFPGKEPGSKQKEQAKGV